MYFASMEYHTLKKICDTQPIEVVKSKDVKFTDRSFGNKLQYLTYKALNFLYGAVIFYFVPFGVFVVTFLHSSVYEAENINQ